MQGSEKRTYYPFIDGLRAYSVIGVLIAHGFFFFRTQNLDGLFYKIITFLGPLGHLGVDAFFIISGFLITGILIPNFTDDIGIKRFYFRRFFKIIPQYYALLFFTMLFLFVFKGFDLQSLQVFCKNVINHLLFINNYTSSIDALQHTWSLAVEEHFYVVYPLLVCFIFKIIHSPEARHRGLVVMMVLIVILTILYRDILNPLPIKTIILQRTTHYRFDALAFGCLLKLLEPYYAKGNDSFWKVVSPILFISGILIYVLFLNVLENGLFIMIRGKNVLGYLAPSLILVAVYRAPQVFRVLFENRFITWLGKKSYGIYLWHYPLIFIILHFSPEMGQGLSVILYFFASILVGTLSTDTVESFFLRMRSRLFP